MMSDRPDELAEASLSPPQVGDDSRATHRPEVDDHAGHRQRVRERFLRVGGDALEDYELLELALQLVIPRKDTKGLAKTLLREFGTFSGVFNASEARLAQIKGLGDTSIAHIKVIQAVAARFGRDRIDAEQPILSSWSQLIDYCRSQMAFQSIEQFRIH
jgi:DNA repair protein RadC